MKIAYIYMKGRSARLAEARAGAAPTEFFYGAIELERAGHELEYFEFDPELPARPWMSLLDKFREFLPAKMDGRSVAQGFKIRHELRDFDCVVATAGKVAFPLALTLRGGPPLVSIHCGLMNYGMTPVRRFLTTRALQHMHTVLFGEAEKEPMQRAFQLAEEQITVNQFGVDTSFWSPGTGDERTHILAIGNDGRRDFSTLLDAAPQIPAEIHIITKLSLHTPLPANVTHHVGRWHDAEISDSQLRDLYRRSRCVVVPLKPSCQPSGQSVSLQAMACGAPVVLTETEGLWSRSQILHGENVLLCRAGDAANLASSVNRILNEPKLAAQLSLAGRAHTMQSASIIQFASTIGGICQGLTSSR